MRQCEECDKWASSDDVVWVMLTDYTEWLLCPDCRNEKQADIVSVLPD